MRDRDHAPAPQADFHFRGCRYSAEVVTQARHADVAIVSAHKLATEGFNQPDPPLLSCQDALIVTVARANHSTIVALQTGGSILMPWLKRTAAVVKARTRAR